MAVVLDGAHRKKALTHIRKPESGFRWGTQKEGINPYQEAKVFYAPKKSLNCGTVGQNLYMIQN